MNTSEALKHVGLNDKEIQIYVALLQLGRATAYAIAKKSGLKRPTVYVILEELKSKGVVHDMPYAGRMVFVPKTPEALFEEAVDKMNEAKKVLPQLIAISQEEKKPKVLYFEGLDGMREAINYKIEDSAGKEIVGFFAYVPSMSKDLQAIFDDYNNRIKKYSIKIRGIAPEHSSLADYRKLDAEFGRLMKKVPFSKYDSTVSIDVTEDFVRIAAYEDLQAVLIENKQIANTVKKIFEMVWEENHK